MKTSITFSTVKVETIVSLIETTLEYSILYAKENGYRVIKNDKYTENESSLKTKIGNLSYSAKKRLIYRLMDINEKVSMRRINTNIHYIFKRVLNAEVPFTVKLSEKEEEIQKKRREWKEARKIADEKLLEYKNEKGNFYKEKQIVIPERTLVL